MNSYLRMGDCNYSRQGWRKASQARARRYAMIHEWLRLRGIASKLPGCSVIERVRSYKVEYPEKYKVLYAVAKGIDVVKRVGKV